MYCSIDISGTQQFPDEDTPFVYINDDQLLESNHNEINYFLNTNSSKLMININFNQFSYKIIVL